MVTIGEQRLNNQGRDNVENWLAIEGSHVQPADQTMKTKLVGF
jgi:hypothetical protein